MKSLSRAHILTGALLLVLWSGSSMVGQTLTGRLELSSPDYDLFSPTDWIDAATFTLKERIPAGITGFIYTSAPAKVWLQGIVLKQTSDDPQPKELARFYVTSGHPIDVRTPSGSEYVYTIALGALAHSSDIDLQYIENKPEIDNLKDQIQKGIAALTGRFTVRVYLRDFYTPNIDDGGPTLGPAYVRTFNIPFSSPDQAKIKVQIDPVVTVPNPTILVTLPAERPRLEYQVAVYLVQDNPRDAVENGVPVWRERVTDGRSVLIYPPTATPLTSGSRYVLVGTSYYQGSSSQQKLGIDGDLVEFRYEDPAQAAGGATGDGGSSTSDTPGSSATRPDPIQTIFGSISTNIPTELAQKLGPVLRNLQDQGWNFSQFRYNNRTVTLAELLNLISQFENASVTVVQ